MDHLIHGSQHLQAHTAKAEMEDSLGWCDGGLHHLGPLLEV